MQNQSQYTTNEEIFKNTNNFKLLINKSLTPSTHQTGRKLLCKKHTMSFCTYLSADHPQFFQHETVKILPGRHLHAQGVKRPGELFALELDQVLLGGNVGLGRTVS